MINAEGVLVAPSMAMLRDLPKSTARRPTSRLRAVDSAVGPYIRTNSTHVNTQDISYGCYNITWRGSVAAWPDPIHAGRDIRNVGSADFSDRLEQSMAALSKCMRCFIQSKVVD